MIEKLKLNIALQKGFSLVEVLLVIAIIGLTLLLIANIPSSVNLIGNSKFSSLAKEIASAEIERWRSTPYNNLGNNLPDGDPVLDSRVDRLPSGSGAVLIDECPAEICKNNEEAFRLMVSIKWKESGKDQKLEVTTIISEGGLK